MPKENKEYNSKILFLDTTKNEQQPLKKRNSHHFLDH